MPSLFVTCRRCRFEFPSGIALTGPLVTLSIFGLRHRCPRCRSEASYYTSEYHLPAGSDLPSGHAPTAYYTSPGRLAAANLPLGDRPSDGTARAPFGWLTGARVFGT
ncbi:MAG: hypothetical protein WA688_09855 [Thermoplasmata archaeon]